MLTWEYPPVVVGGLGRHAHALATALAAAGHEVVVLARRPTGTDATTHPTLDAVVDGVMMLPVLVTVKLPLFQPCGVVRAMVTVVSTAAAGAATLESAAAIASVKVVCLGN